MGRFRSKAGAKKGAGDCCAVQTGHPAGQPFCSWQSYGAVTADAALYRNLRENIPILDAAIGKLVMHKIHRPDFIDSKRHLQRFWLFTYEAFARFNAHVQL